MMRNSQKKNQVKVCHVCGNKGFSTALINCSKCPCTFAHQYCIGIPPGSVDSSFTWVCEYSCEPAEHEPSVSMMPDDASANRKMKAVASLYSNSCTNRGMGNKHKRKRDLLLPDIEALSTSRSRYKVKRLESRSLSANRYGRREDIATNKQAKVEAKSKSGSSPKFRDHRNNNVKIRSEEKRWSKGATSCESPTDPNNWKLVLLEEQPKPLLTLMPIEYEGTSEQTERSYGSLRTEPTFMDCPKEIMRGVVLLVSPLGEIYVESTSFTDDQYPTDLATAILRLTNGYCDFSSNDLVVNEDEQTSLNNSIEETNVLDEIGRCSDMQDLGQKISEVPERMVC